MILSDFTENILCEIWNYLTFEEKWQFVMSNQLIYKEMDSHHCQIYQLNEDISWFYYRDSAFRANVNAQIRKDKLTVVLRERNFLTDVSCLDGLYGVELKKCPQITDVSALGSVQRVTLDCCRGIRDVSPLHNVDSLHIYDCFNVTDVSALGKVRYLCILFIM